MTTPEQRKQMREWAEKQPVTTTHMNCKDSVTALLDEVEELEGKQRRIDECSHEKVSPSHTAAGWCNSGCGQVRGVLEKDSYLGDLRGYATMLGVSVQARPDATQVVDGYEISAAIRELLERAEQAEALVERRGQDGEGALNVKAEGKLVILHMECGTSAMQVALTGSMVTALVADLHQEAGKVQRTART